MDKDYKTFIDQSLVKAMEFIKRDEDYENFQFKIISHRVTPDHFRFILKTNPTTLKLYKLTFNKNDGLLLNTYEITKGVTLE